MSKGVAADTRGDTPSSSSKAVKPSTLHGAESAILAPVLPVWARPATWHVHLGVPSHHSISTV
jgi:hypothetical protein